MPGRREEPAPANTRTSRLLGGRQTPLRVLKHRAQIPASLGPHTHGRGLLGGNTWGDTGLCVPEHITAGPSLPLGAGKGHPLAHLPLPSSLTLRVTCARCGLSPCHSRPRLNPVLGGLP